MTTTFVWPILKVLNWVVLVLNFEKGTLFFQDIYVGIEMRFNAFDKDSFKHYEVSLILN